MSAVFFVGTTPARDGLSQHTIDAIPGCTVLRDDPPSGGSWNNVRSAMMYVHDAEWTVICDDDVVLCRNFVTEAPRALAHCPGDIASLIWITRSGAVKLAVERGASWIETPFHVYGGCFAVRARLGPSIARWGAEHLTGTRQSGDWAVSLWAAAHGVRCYGLVPSIADHAPGIESLIYAGVTNESRRACVFDSDPSNREWNSAAVPYGRRAESLLAVSEQAGWYAP